MSDDKFFERLRNDAAALRHVPDEQTLARIRARIHEQLAQQPTVAELLAAWFRPLAATLTAIVLAAAIGLATIDNEEPSLEPSVEIVVGGDSYRVGP